MFMLKYALIPFILLPGAFITLLIISGIWFLFRKNRKAGMVNLMIGALMWLLSTSPASDALLKGLEHSFTVPKNPKGDVIIILGGGAYDGTPDLTGVGTPSEMMLYRVVTAVRLHKMLKVPIILSGGTVFKHMKPEAPIVKRFLMDLGVPDNAIIMEDQSLDTSQNAKNSQKICLESGYKTPILVTSAFHMKRSVMQFKSLGMEVIPFPTGFQSWNNRPYGWIDLLPGNFGGVSMAVREYLALIFYRYLL
jgi:uncharacterized SAM-binding protein YcdF (DUF218 family)